MTINHPIANQDVRRTNSLHLNAVFMGTTQSAYFINRLCSPFNIRGFLSFQNLHDYLNNQTFLTLPDVVLLELDSEGSCFDLVSKIKANPLLRGLVIVLIAPVKNKEWEIRALQLKVSDYYTMPFPIDHLLERLHFLVIFQLVKSELSALYDDNHLTPPPGLSNISGAISLLQRIFQRK